MKNLYQIILFSIITVVLTSCEIVQETKFEEDGSGKYTMGFDMSELMKMGGDKFKSKEGSAAKKQVDTVIDFAKFLEEKKDSIKKLSKEDRKKLEELEDLKIAIKSDTVTSTFTMKIEYDFEDLKDLATISQKLKDANVKELDKLSGKTGGKEGKGDFPNISDMMDIEFDSSHFSAKINAKTLADAEKKKDTTMTEDNPMADLIRFKVRYVFPHKIKSVSNENARILSDFKGIEFSANLFDTNENPHYFDVDIDFE